jgi:transposase
MGRAKPPCAPEFRAEATRLVRSDGLSQSQAARDLGVSTFTLRNWLWQAEIDAGVRPGLTSDEREELTRLRRENRLLL